MSKAKTARAKVALSRPSEGASGLTGLWRLRRPVIDPAKCTKCHLCWLYCPEGAIARRADGAVWMIYEYCKGCGVCSEVCPSKSISLIKEG